MLDSDLAYENAMNSINPNIKALIASIPRISVNFKARHLTYDESSQALSLPEVLQLGAFMQVYLYQFNKYFAQDNPIDLYGNTPDAIRRFLKGIYDTVINDKKNNQNKELTAGYWAQRRQFIKEMGPALETAISLYEYLYNNENRAQRATKSIQRINNTYREQGRKFSLDIEALLCMQLTSSAAPTMLEYNMNGTLFGEDASNVYASNVKQKALLNQQVFALKSIVRDTLQTYSCIQSEDFIKNLELIGKSTKTLAALRDDAVTRTALQDVMQRMFSIDINTNDQAIALMDDAIRPIKSIFLSVAEALKKYQQTKESGQVLWGVALQKEITKDVEKAVATIDFESISTVLNPILGSAQYLHLEIEMVTLQMFTEPPLWYL